MHKNFFFGCILISLGVFLSACNMPLTSTLLRATGSSQTWIDAPLEGTILQPEAPYQLVVHAYDPNGVAQLELSANGEILANLAASANQELAVFKFDWLPHTTGNVILLARTQGTNGGWNSEASVVVSIGEISPTPSPSFTPTMTTSPTATTFTDTPTPTSTETPTLTPTTTPTLTPTPTAPAGLSFTPRVSTNQIFTGRCGVNIVTIQALVSDPSSVRDMVLFTNIKNQNNGKTTGWDGGTGMSSAGNGWYQVTLAAGSIPNYNAYESSWLLYQFVATGDGGVVIGRSQTFNDIAITRCEAPPPENPTIVVPPIYNRLTPTLVFPPILR